MSSQNGQLSRLTVNTLSSAEQCAHIKRSLELVNAAEWFFCSAIYGCRFRRNRASVASHEEKCDFVPRDRLRMRILKAEEP